VTPDLPVTIRFLRDEGEARLCAGMLVASEPWITLDVTMENAMQRLTDPTREVYVATVPDQIVGVLILFLNGTLKGYIQTIAVHPDWRSRGMGRQIIEFAEQRIFRLSPNVFLCVSSFNLRAQKFYERLGYQRVGELTDFVVKGCSEVLMRKSRGRLRDFKPGG
jgi:ribosomal-protein-alanine N-acetyltransferase